MVRAKDLSKKLLALATAIMIAAMYIPFTVFAATNPTVNFNGTYNESSKTLTVKAMVKNPDNALGAGVFFLKYDTSVLTIEKKNVKAGSATYEDEDGEEYSITSSAKYLDADKGYVGFDWGTSGKAFAPNNSFAEIAVFTFSFVSGKSNADLTSKSIAICEDTAFLNETGGYGNDGGVLIVDGTTNYSTKLSNVKVNISIPVTEQPKEDKIVSLKSAEVTTNAGTAPELPSKVKATYESGKTADVSVNWNAVSEDKYAAAGSFEVEGTVEGFSGKAICKVTVKAVEDKIVSLKSAEVTTNAGTAPKLPATVQATYESGKTEDVSVKWNTVSEDKYAAAGSFDVEGTVEGFSGKAICKITVKAVEDKITSLETAKVTTDAGTAPKLPAKVKATYQSGKIADVSVKWNAVSEDKYASAGSFEVEGTVEGFSGKAVCKVTVKKIEEKTEDKITSLKAAEVTTNLGMAPKLPAKVQATYESGKTADVAVTWDEVSEEKYAAVGSFEVEGTVEGFSNKAKCEVTVGDAVVTKFDVVNVTVVAGYLPEIPETVKAYFSDGTEKTVNVKWLSVEREMFMTPGETVEVKGLALDAGALGIPAIDGTVVPIAKVLVGEPVVVSVKDTSVKTPAGTAPKLPDTIEATFSNDTKAFVNVEWAKVDAAKYASEGKFTVKGKVNYGAEIEVTCEVTVDPKPATDPSDPTGPTTEPTGKPDTTSSEKTTVSTKETKKTTTTTKAKTDTKKTDERIDKNNPKTGDESNYSLAYFALMASSIVLCSMRFSRRKYSE